jgi:uncharacterized protein with HEPN domain
MEDQLRKYLWDILERITLLEEATAPPLSVEQFTVNRILTAAAERHIEVIGEALNPDFSVGFFKNNITAENAKTAQRFA